MLEKDKSNDEKKMERAEKSKAHLKNIEILLSLQMFSYLLRIIVPAVVTNVPEHPIKYYLFTFVTLAFIPDMIIFGHAKLAFKSQMWNPTRSMNGYSLLVVCITLFQIAVS